MNVMMNVSKFALLSLFSLTVLSCSTEDSGTEPVPPKSKEPQLKTGVFLDSEVEGLTYTTATQNGTTNANGEFFYYEGENISFSIGDVELGTAAAEAEMTPVSIATTADASIESAEVKNIAAFLQTLDSDANPSNGINIDPAVISAIEVTGIDFTGNIVGLLGEMVAKINLATGSDLQVVYPEQAAAHMAATLGEEYDTVDVVFSSFLPTFSHYYSGTAAQSVYWIHETDEAGRLEKSSRYEKYPNRLNMEIFYIDYNELNLPTSFELVNIINGTPGPSTFFSINYSEEKEIARISALDANDNISNSVVFREIDEQLRASIVENRNNNGGFIQRGEKVFDLNGNTIETYIYTSEDATVADLKWENTYTEFGDFDLLTSISAEQTSWRQYSYREDHTLEKMVMTYNNNEAVTTFEYDEAEVLKKAILDWEWTTVIRYFHENGIRSKEEHYDENGNLIKIDTFDEDGNLISSEAA
ncbi:MAG: hypothetical protein WBL27_08355 [Salinimicrobium sp.]